MSASISPSSPLLTPQQAAKYLKGITARGLERWRTTGDGPVFVKIGRRVYYTSEALDAFITKQRMKSTSQAA